MRQVWFRPQGQMQIRNKALLLRAGIFQQIETEHIYRFSVGCLPREAWLGVRQGWQQGWWVVISNRWGSGGIH